MIPAPDAGVFAYAVGEEVVVLLDGVEVFDLDHASVVPGALLPEWTIAHVASDRPETTQPTYLLRTRLYYSDCICVAGADRIEGLA